MTSTKEKAPVVRQHDEGRGTYLGGRSAENRTGATLAGLPAALPWAARLIRAGGADVPDYGSPAWHALPADSPARVAACVRAAEAWRIYTSPAEVARRLRAELDAARAEEDRAEWSPEIVARVHRSANRPSFAELCDRRGEPARAARAREHEERMRGAA